MPRTESSTDPTPIRFHPAADLFPAMTGDEFAALVADIREHGVREPVTTLDGAIIDGRHRWRACEQLGIECPRREWAGDGSPLSFVVSANLRRRHLDAGQRACVAVALLPLLAAEALERKAAAGQAFGRGRPGKVEARSPQPNGRAPQARDIAGAAVGVGGRAVSDAKRLAAEAPDLFAAVRAGTTTLPAAVREVRRAERIAKIADISRDSIGLDSVRSRYPVILADPPWRYEHVVSESRAVENQYPTMDLDAICALRPPATEDAVLFLWATSPKLEEALRVVREWGFSYRTCMVWVKDRIGMGYYARQRHELLLVATRGELPPPPPSARPDSVIQAPRGEHSEKPPIVHGLIAAMYPDLPRIELFSRAPVEGWAGWGYEA